VDDLFIDLSTEERALYDAVEDYIQTFLRFFDEALQDNPDGPMNNMIACLPWRLTWSAAKST
jgi:hypothetical protein